MARDTGTGFAGHQRRFPLAEFARAPAYVETGHRHGNVVAVGG